MMKITYRIIYWIKLTFLSKCVLLSLESKWCASIDSFVDFVCAFIKHKILMSSTIRLISLHKSYSLTKSRLVYNWAELKRMHITTYVFRCQWNNFALFIYVFVQIGLTICIFISLKSKSFHFIRTCSTERIKVAFIFLVLCIFI